MYAQSEDFNLQNKITENIKYTGLFLNSEQKNLLLEKFPPIYDKVVVDHVTLKYQPENGILRTEVGKIYEIKITKYLVNKELGSQVLILEIPEEIADAKIIPHITISKKLDLPSIKDYSDVVSSLTMGEIVELSNPIQIKVVSGFFDSNLNKPITHLD